MPLGAMSGSNMRSASGAGGSDGNGISAAVPGILTGHRALHTWRRVDPVGRAGGSLPTGGAMSLPRRSPASGRAGARPAPSGVPRPAAAAAALPGGRSGGGSGAGRRRTAANAPPGDLAYATSTTGSGIAETLTTHRSLCNSRNRPDPVRHGLPRRLSSRHRSECVMPSPHACGSRRSAAAGTRRRGRADLPGPPARGPGGRGAAGRAPPPRTRRCAGSGRCATWPCTSSTTSATIWASSARAAWTPRTLHRRAGCCWRGVPQDAAGADAAAVGALGRAGSARVGSAHRRRRVVRRALPDLRPLPAGRPADPGRAAVVAVRRGPAGC